MKFLLTAVNAKYIHSNPAIYSLRAYSIRKEPALEEHMELAEYTINQPFQEILADIYGRKPDCIAFSCYIWNWEMIQDIPGNLPRSCLMCRFGWADRKYPTIRKKSWGKCLFSPGLWWVRER